MDTPIAFPEDQMKMLKWLFNEGLADAKRDKDLPMVAEFSALEETVRRLQPDQSYFFSREDIVSIARAVDVGRDRFYSKINSDQMKPEKAAIDRLLATLVAAAQE